MYCKSRETLDPFLCQHLSHLSKRFLKMGLCNNTWACPGHLIDVIICEE